VETYLEIPVGWANDSNIPFLRQSEQDRGGWLAQELVLELRTSSSFFNTVEIQVVEGPNDIPLPHHPPNGTDVLSQALDHIMHCAELHDQSLDLSSFDDSDNVVGMLNESLDVETLDAWELGRAILGEIGVRIEDLSNDFVGCLSLELCPPGEDCESYKPPEPIPEQSLCQMLLQAVENDTLSRDFCEAQAIWYVPLRSPFQPPSPSVTLCQFETAARGLSSCRLI
jgi:hypothetical protein